MLPLIVFFLALMLTITTLRITIQEANEGSAQDVEGFIVLIIKILTCSLWTWLFYLTH